MQKKFLSSLLLILLLNLLIKPFYILGIDAEVQNRVGELAYGNYFSLLNFSFLLNILLDFGITNYNTRNIAQHPQLIQHHFTRLLSLRVMLLFLYVLCTGALGWGIGYEGEELYLLLILMANQFLVAVIQFCRSNFAGLHLFKTDALISVLDRAILIILCSLMLWTHLLGEEISIRLFVYAQTIAYGISAIISLILLLPKTTRSRFLPKKAFSLYMLKASFPYALLILLMMMYNRIDAVMLERLLPNGNESAGIYAQGFRLLDAVNMFALIFAGLLLPIFARILKEKKGVEEMVSLSVRILFGISVTVAISAFLFSATLIEWRYPGSSEAAYDSFSWLILSFIPVSITYVFGTLLTANGSLKYLNWMAFFGVILNVVLNLILIPKMGVKGAALATFITQGLTALIQLIVAYQIFKFQFSIRFYLRIGSFLIAFLGLGLWLGNLMENTIAGFGAVFGTGVLLGFVTGMYQLQDLKAILRRD